MRYTLTIASAVALLSTAAVASDRSYDRNEALSPEMIEMIQEAYANDFGTNTQIIRVAGDTETWSATDFEMIKAAFALGS